jgi:hypothetical protein
VAKSKRESLGNGEALPAHFPLAGEMNINEDDLVESEAIEKSL